MLFHLNQQKNNDAPPPQHREEVIASVTVEQGQSSVHVTANIDGDESIIGSFLDLFDMSEHTCCGNNYIL
jgi:hypothetical protein